QTLKYIYKMMAEHKHLTWGILDSDAHYPQVVFHIQDPPNFDDGSDGDADTSHDDDASNGPEWWTDDDEVIIIIGEDEGGDTEEEVTQ
ncbi:MAG: hypothetical protein GY738_28915, partial [Pseudoalteromonas sp.]|nr:hypothetical protein [Pseudoalteromonas sp.]